jgi:hypothetical protein
MEPNQVVVWIVPVRNLGEPKFPNWQPNGHVAAASSLLTKKVWRREFESSIGRRKNYDSMQQSVTREA